MRAAVPTLTTPHPITEQLPGMLQADPFARGFVEGLDEVWAPIFSVLDNLMSYFDADLTDADFLDWLGRWVGVEIDETWPDERRRAFVKRASDIYRIRGTAAGMKAHVGVWSGGRVEIAETGGVSWSQTSGGDLPGEAEPRMTIRVVPPRKQKLDQRLLDLLVRGIKPAHVVHQVEVVDR